VRVGQLLSWIGVAGQNSGTARLLGGPGPGAEREAQFELALVADLASR